MEYEIVSFESAEKGKKKIRFSHGETFTLYAGEAAKLSLREGVHLSEETYQKILHEILGKRATKRAMHLLERQERTEYQLKEKLRQNEYPSAAIEDAVSYVKKYHYLDDERYARTFVHFHQDKKSRLRLQMDLKKRGIANDIIEKSLEEEFVSDEKEKIKELLYKKKFNGEKSDSAEFRRIYQFLMRRGFKSAEVLSVMKGFSEDSYEEL